MAVLDLVPPVDIKGRRGWGEAGGSVISSRKDLDPAKSPPPLAGGFVSLIPLCPAGREVAWSSPTGDRQAGEILVGAQHHRPCLLGSTSSAIPHHEWLLMDLGDLGPPQDLGHQDGTPKEGGKERGGGGGGRQEG